MSLQVALCALFATAAYAQVGPSGIVDSSGNNVQFTHEFANNIVLRGPSGIVTKDGTNLQLTHSQAELNAGLPAVPVSQFVGSKAVGPSGIVDPSAGNTQFTHEFASNIVLIGPSGIVTRDGNNMQLRKKRSAPLIGPSGIVFADGRNHQFLKPGVTIVLEGPSAYLLSDGTGVQKRVRRSVPQAPVVGASGIITPDNKLIQLPAGVSVVVASHSGAVLSNGQNIQF